MDLTTEHDARAERSSEPSLRALLALSDSRLVEAVAQRLCTPRREPASSFVLHAPLELAARAALLPRVHASQRERARIRMAAIATEYEAAGEPMPEPASKRFASDDDAVRRLSAAIAAGELDDVDAIACFVGRHVAPDRLVRLLADSVVPSLSAAAHASIFFYQLPRVSPRGELTLALLRPLARELAREPSWRLTWHESLEPDAPVHASKPLFRALADTPFLGVPGSDFIYPLMSQVERHGVAEALLRDAIAGCDLRDGSRTLLRAAASSMLHEDEQYARYGWSHCLTLPQAVLGIAHVCASPRRALAIAATYVVGFRAAMARAPLDDRFAPAPPGMSFARALEDAPERASAALWHTPAEGLDDAVTHLVSYAATYPDAHLAKYLLACLDAAHDDRSHARLYLAAAAKLASVWRRSEAWAGRAE